jgi:GTP cyclohydrolase II
MPAPAQTNNPRKLDVLGQLGVTISGRIPCQVQAGEHNQVGRDSCGEGG